MNRILAVLTCIVLAAALAAAKESTGESTGAEESAVGTSGGQTQSAVDKQKTKAKTDRPQTTVTQAQEVLEAGEELELTEKQAEKIEELMKKRDAEIAKRREAIARGQEQIEAAEENAHTAAQKRQIEEARKQLMETYAIEPVQAGFAHQIVGVLEPKQRARWNTPRLCAQVVQEFRGVDLTEEQKTEIDPLCKEACERLARPLDVRYVPAVSQVVAETVYRKLLTAEQQKTYVEAKQADKNRNAAHGGKNKGGGSNKPGNALKH